MSIVKIKQTYPPVMFNTKESLSDPFNITTGYVRVAVDNNGIEDDTSTGAFIDIGSTPTVGDCSGYLINNGTSEIIKIDAPKKFIGAKVFSNAHQTTISFIGNGLLQDNPFVVGEYITVTNCIDDAYNQSLVHVRIAQRTKDLLNLDIDLTGYPECNSALTINLSTRLAVRSFSGSGLLSIAEVHPVN